MSAMQYTEDEEVLVKKSAIALKNVEAYHTLSYPLLSRDPGPSGVGRCPKMWFATWLATPPAIVLDLETVFAVPPFLTAAGLSLGVFGAVELAQRWRLRCRLR